jgi:outer membrane protein assembly factor BamE (lipoprotein component of BamABCDE complex)
MTKWAVCGVGVLLVVLPACVAVPIPVPERTVAGSPVTPAMTAPIQPGVTTRSEVIQLLGEPALELPAHRIIAYPWEALIG